MKWQFAIAALALVWPCAARGLKTPRSTEVEAENEALKKRNRHLEAMMQVARSEVQRMDKKLESGRQHHDNLVVGDHAEVVSQEVDDLRAKLKSVEADKKSLVQTLRQMLSKNATKIYQAQARNAVQAQRDLEAKCGQERTAFEVQIKEAKGTVDETKEMTQTLQEQNMDLQRTVHDLRAKLAESEKTRNAFAGDKANLVETMHSLMRESAKFKKELETEMQKEKKSEQELAADEVKLDRLSKMKSVKTAKKPVAEKTAARKIPSTQEPLHLNHQESMASKIAKMNHINRYIERTIVDGSDDVSDQAASVDLTKQADDMQKEEEILVHKHTSENPKDLAEASALMKGNQGLGDWLGLKVAPVKAAAPGVHKDANGLSPIDALDPEAVKQEKAVQEKKAKAEADDGGDGIENLLAQAKDQLNDMDSAEASNSA